MNGAPSSVVRLAPADRPESRSRYERHGVRTVIRANAVFFYSTAFNRLTPKAQDSLPTAPWLRRA